MESTGLILVGFSKEAPENRMAAAVAAVKNRTEKEEKFQVLEEPLRFDRREPNPNPVRRETAKVKRKAQNLDGHRVRTESEPRPPPLWHGRASGCTPFSGTMKPLPLDGIQVAMGPQPAGPPQPLHGPQVMHVACTLCGKAEGRLNCKNSSCHRRVCQDCLQQVAYGKIMCTACFQNTEDATGREHPTVLSEDEG